MNISKCKCGGNAIIRQDNFGVYYSDWKIFCEKCGMQTGWTKNKEDAIEIWNRVMDATDINAGHKFDKDINVSSKGRWINVTTKAWVPDFQCSECGEKYVYQHNFCPNCGVDMRNEHE